MLIHKYINRFIIIYEASNNRYQRDNLVNIKFEEGLSHERGASLVYARNLDLRTNNMKKQNYNKGKIWNLKDDKETQTKPN